MTAPSRSDLLAELVAIHMWQDRFDTNDGASRVREIHNELNQEGSR